MWLDSRAAGCGAAALPYPGRSGHIEVVDLEPSQMAPTARSSLETANLPARRFWLRWFMPVCLSFERDLDDRLASKAGTAR